MIAQIQILLAVLTIQPYMSVENILRKYNTYIYIYIYIYNELFQIRKRTISNLILKVSRFPDYHVNKS